MAKMETWIYVHLDEEPGFIPQHSRPQLQMSCAFRSASCDSKKSKSFGISRQNTYVIKYLRDIFNLQASWGLNYVSGNERIL